jgi:hypothetical protein
MFYSINEISFMSKSHSTDLRHACENCRRRVDKEKQNRNIRLLQAVAGVLSPIVKKLK